MFDLICVCNIIIYTGNIIKERYLHIKNVLKCHAENFDTYINRPVYSEIEEISIIS